jgi:hypothetical protein
MSNLMSSWYARNLATPGHNLKENAIPNVQQRRGSSNNAQTHRTALSTANSRTINLSNTSQKSQSFIAKQYFNPYVGSVPGRKSGQQCVTAPASIVNCDRDRVPMSQLTSSFDSTGNGSHISQESHCRRSIPVRVALDKETDGRRGISPFNTGVNLSTNASSSNVSQMHSMPERNSFPSSITQRTAPESRSLHPYAGMYRTHGQQHSQSSHSSSQRNNDLAPMNSQNTSKASEYLNPSFSNECSNSGIPRFQSKKQQDYSYHTIGSRSLLTNSQSQASYQNDDAHLRALIDNRILEVLNDHLEPKIKDFDDRQLSFYRRISEAEEKHIQCIKEVDNKHAACVKQIKELDKRSSKIDHQVLHATKTIAKCTTEMEKQAVEFHTKGLHVETMYRQVTEMLKSVEMSTTNLKEITASSISSIKHAHEAVMESTLPLIKQRALEIISSLAASFGFNRTVKAELRRADAVMDSLPPTEIERHDASSKKNSIVSTPRIGLSKSINKSPRLRGYAKDRSIVKTTSASSKDEDHKLKATKLGDTSLLKPLSFTKVNNTEYKLSLPTKVPKEVQVSESKFDKSSKDTLSKKGNPRTASVKGKSTTQEKSIKEISSYPTPTTQLNPPFHNTTPQPSKVVSPFTSIESKPLDGIATYTPTSSMPNSFRRSVCETPSRCNISANSASPRLGKVRLQSRKRNVLENTTMNKRARSRYGRVRSTFEGDEMEYSFLSN